MAQTRWGLELISDAQALFRVDAASPMIPAIPVSLKDLAAARSTVIGKPPTEHGEWINFAKWSQVWAQAGCVSEAGGFGQPRVCLVCRLCFMRGSYFAAARPPSREELCTPSSGLPHRVRALGVLEKQQSRT